MSINRYAKAIVGAVVAALSAYQVAQTDNVITTQEWVTIAVAFVTALSIVWGVPNTASTHPETAPADPVEDTAPLDPQQG